MAGFTEKIFSREKGLTVHEMLLELENEEDFDPISIYVCPPLEENETDVDSDKSDNEHEANLNKLGRRMLNAECEVERTQTNGTDDCFDSSDEEPLVKRNKKRRKKCTWKKINPEYELDSNCEPVSPSQKAAVCDSPVDFFELFFSEELLLHILEQTNIYASQKNNILNATLDELKVFLGGLLFSGYGKYPNKRIYWSDKSDVPNILSDNIRLNRFEQILNNLHLNDNAHLDNTDRLYKLRPLIGHLNKAFKEHGGIEENLSIDESMIPYYGKHYAKQFIKGKPIRFGFKNWTLCSSTGYLLQFEIYMGKCKNNNTRVFGLGGDIVVKLLRDANVPQNQGFKTFFDNYFTSIVLLRHLSVNGYCASGTVRENRVENCPVKSKKEMQKMERGAMDYRFTTDGNIFVVRWKDNNVVTLATNFDQNLVGTCNRWTRENGKIAVPQPTVIGNYNKGMGGVDKMDQLIATYRTRIRQRKWWWPIFAYLLDASVSNAWLLMKKLKPNDVRASSLLAFRRYIAISYMESYGKPSQRGKRTSHPLDDVRYDERNHLIQYCEKDKRCPVCSKKANFICIKCQKGLHPKHCFLKYHTK